MTQFFKTNIDVLEQLKELIEHCQSIYTVRENDQTSSIGEHVRHVLDHYRAFQKSSETGCVDYNLRTRCSPEESEPAVAIQSINGLIDWFQSNPVCLDTIPVISELNLHRVASETLQSTSKRELLYLINHSIHHMAYAALMAKSNRVNVPAHIGLAPSTANHQRQHKEEACYETH